MNRRELVMPDGSVIKDSGTQLRWIKKNVEKARLNKYSAELADCLMDALYASRERCDSPWWERSRQLLRKVGSLKFGTTTDDKRGNV